jgi:hypothetical protein
MESVDSTKLPGGEIDAALDRAKRAGCRWAANVARDGWDCVTHDSFLYGDCIDMRNLCPKAIVAEQIINSAIRAKR